MGGDEQSPTRGRDSEETQIPDSEEQTPRNPSANHVSKPAHEESPLLSPSGTAQEEEEGLIEESAILEEDPHDDYHDTKSVFMGCGIVKWNSISVILGLEQVFNGFGVDSWTIIRNSSSTIRRHVE
ncbi:hypothetical protein G7Y89_g2056 [Cudoniella acicularis]|uniref:Uncharacterized protein n=1 Tax=Cudoniella acicularis TaxID=354080 RepID=A0A8H4RVS7_9HELO|nr:hypothetical protein G7Y89_g2056 [Cudoniella acicularis]